MKTEAKQRNATKIEAAEETIDAALEEIHRPYGGDLSSFFQSLRKRQSKEKQNRERESVETKYPDVALSRLVRKS